MESCAKTMLFDLLSNKEFGLALSPGFFRIYLIVGILHAMDDCGVLNPTCVSGSSAGAMAGGFLASGLSPEEMIEKVLLIKRPDIWDVGIGIGLLKGKKLHDVIEKHLKIKTFEDAVIPLGMSAWDITGFSTTIIRKGGIANGMCASACFPGLFQPVCLEAHEGRYHMDGGYYDDSGMMALPSIPADSKLIVNITTDRSHIRSYEDSVPERLQAEGAKLITINVENVPFVHPGNMDTAGRLSYRVARLAMRRALEERCHISVLGAGERHYVCYVDAAGVELEEEEKEEKEEKEGQYKDQKKEKEKEKEEGGRRRTAGEKRGRSVQGHGQGQKTDSSSSDSDSSSSDLDMGEGEEIEGNKNNKNNKNNMNRGGEKIGKSQSVRSRSKSGSRAKASKAKRK